MARLTAAQRAAMPSSSFAGPGHSYPDNDKKHARLAVSGASHAENVGNITPAEKSQIVANVHKDWPSIGGKFKKHAARLKAKQH